MDDPNKKNTHPEDELGNLARDIMRELKATTDLVVDAARLGKNELLHYVQEGMRSGWNSVSRQGAAWSEAAQRSREADAPRTPQKHAATQPTLRRVSRGRWALFTLGMVFFLAAFVCLLTMMGFLYYGQESVGFVLMLVTLGLSVPGAVFTGLFGRKSRRERRYARYLRSVGARPCVSVAEIAAVLHRRESRVLSDLEDMVERGYFGPEARINSARDTLIVDPDAALEAEAERLARAEAERSAAQAQAQPRSDAYDAMLQELRSLNERIEDEAMSQRIYRIEAVARATFLAVKAKPEKLPQIRRFMDYYLPTTIKLLAAYAGFEEQEIKGENIRRSRESIEKMTETLSIAFEKQFDSLFLQDSMDINAEIRTLDSLLRQDGYVGGMTMPGP